ncbi:MAG: hypothetical protein WCC48_18715, partial [Anaeromyxobacteraceae bacterium]
MRSAPVLLAMGLALAGCATTTIVTNDKAARIYADGAFLGKGEVQLHGRTGFPRSMDVTVKTPYAKVDRRVDRKFTGTTFVLGLFTYMTGWLWGWQYPENVVIMLPPRSEGVEG